MTFSSLFVLLNHPVFEERNMPDLDPIRSEIELMRLQVSRHRREMLQLRGAGISTTSAETLLQRMMDKIVGLCVERDRLKAELPKPRKMFGVRKW